MLIQLYSSIIGLSTAPIAEKSYNIAVILVFENIRFIEFNDSWISNQSLSRASKQAAAHAPDIQGRLDKLIEQQKSYRFAFDGRVRLKPPYPVSADDMARYYVPQLFVLCECGPGYYTLREDFASYEILYTYAGEGVLEYGGQQYTLKAGDGFFIDCRKKHHYYTKGERWVHAELHFDGPQAAYHFQEFYKSGNPCFHESRNGKLQTIWEAMLRAWQDFLLYKQLHVSNDISQIMAHLLVLKYQSGSGDSTPDSISRLVKYMDRHFAEPITLDMLSEKVSLSKYHLSREFKRYMGVAPMQYLQYVRLENAKLMLLHTKLPVHTVAQGVGFSDVNNFDRQFLRHTGVTPVRFRKSNQNSR